MTPHHQRVVSVLGIGALGAALIWGGQSLTASYASGVNQAASTPAVATPAAPGNGFTEVAKLVTPAVVNITTVMTERISDDRSLPDDLRDRMEEFFGKPFGPRGRGQQHPGEPR